MLSSLDSDLSVEQGRPGFVVPAWRAGSPLSADPVSLAPWRSADASLVDLLVDALSVSSGDLFVDLGSGDGRVVLGVAARSGCCAVGVEASAPLVLCSRRALRFPAPPVRVGGCLRRRVSFLHEVIGARGFGGASILFAWLLPSAFPLVASIVEDARRAGPLRVFVVVGALSGWPSEWEFERIGSVGVSVPEFDWVPCGSVRVPRLLGSGRPAGVYPVHKVVFRA